MDTKVSDIVQNIAQISDIPEERLKKHLEIYINSGELEKRRKAFRIFFKKQIESNKQEMDKINGIVLKDTVKIETQALLQVQKLAEKHFEKDQLETRRKEEEVREIRTKKLNSAKFNNHYNKSFAGTVQEERFKFFDVDNVLLIKDKVIETGNEEADQLCSLYSYNQHIYENTQKENQFKNKQDFQKDFDKLLDELTQFIGEEELDLKIQNLSIFLKKVDFFSNAIYTHFSIKVIDKMIGHLIDEDAEEEFKSLWLYPLKTLCCSHELIEKHFKAKLFDLCPLIVPTTFNKSDKPKSNEFYKNMGYQFQGTQIESEEEYIKSKLNYFLIFCKIFVEPVEDNLVRRFDIKEGWVWINRFICTNLPSEFYSLLLEFLKECGESIVEAYGLQAINLLLLIKKKVLPKNKEPYILLTIDILDDLLKDYVEEESESEREATLSKSESIANKEPIDIKPHNIINIGSEPKTNVIKRNFGDKKLLLSEAEIEAGKYLKVNYAMKNLKQRIETKEGHKVIAEIRGKIKSRLGQATNSKDSIMSTQAAIQSDLDFALKSNKLFYMYDLNYLTKNIMNQAGNEIASNPSAAFPLARVILGLCNKYKELPAILKARFYKRCPYIIPNATPIYIKDMPMDMYQKRMGFVKKGDKYEDLETYCKRINGIFYLYCALIQFDEKDGLPNIFGIYEAWIWLVRCSSAKPKAISAELLNTFLEVCGPKLLATYKTQAIKVVLSIQKGYLAKLPNTLKASNGRLAITLDNFVKGGFKIPYARGRDLPGQNGNRNMLNSQTNVNFGHSSMSSNKPHNVSYASANNVSGTQSFTPTFSGFQPSNNLTINANSAGFQSITNVNVSNSGFIGFRPSKNLLQNQSNPINNPFALTTQKSDNNSVVADPSPKNAFLRAPSSNGTKFNTFSFNLNLENSPDDNNN